MHVTLYIVHIFCIFFLRNIFCIYHVNYLPFGKLTISFDESSSLGPARIMFGHNSKMEFLSLSWTSSVGLGRVGSAVHVDPTVPARELPVQFFSSISFSLGHAYAYEMSKH
jgi:hypothetical protein